MRRCIVYIALYTEILGRWILYCISEHGKIFGSRRLARIIYGKRGPIRHSFLLVKSRNGKAASKHQLLSNVLLHTKYKAFGYGIKAGRG